MKGISVVLVLALALTACAEPHSGSTAPSYVASTSGMPPRRVADCVSYVLLDNKCTADWYRCSGTSDRGQCMREWTACCTLPGNTARNTIVTSPQTP